jgi:hypothetical protein
MTSDNNMKLLLCAVLSDIQSALLCCRICRLCAFVFLIKYSTFNTKMTMEHCWNDKGLSMNAF